MRWAPEPQRLFGELFGFGSWDKDTGPDPHLEIKEAGAADQILKRVAGAAKFYQPFEGAGRLRIDRAREASQQRCSVDLQRVPEQSGGLDSRRVDAGCLESTRSDA